MFNLSVMEVLKILEDRVPLRVPELSWTDRQIFFYAGQRNVIDQIYQLLEDDPEQGQLPGILNKGD